MSTILAIDTSTQACSCALNINGVIHENFDLIPRQHAQKLLPMIEALLKAHSLTFTDLDAVAYGQGPGSFTGLRIAAGVVQGIAFGADLPVIPVSTLASLALQLRDEIDTGLILSTLDARIDEVYWGFFRLDGQELTAVGEEGLCKPEFLPVPIPGNPALLNAAGSGLAFLKRMPAPYQDVIASVHKDLHPRAGVMAELAQAMLRDGRIQSAEEVNPVYLRDKVTHA